MKRKLYVNLERCIGNEKCPAVRVCPMDALYQEKGEMKPSIRTGSCIACGTCIRICHEHALQITEG